MNYRKLFIAAVLLNIALGAAVYWISRSSQPAATEQAPVEHSPMEGFSTGTPPEGTAPPLTRIELTPERMQSIGVRTGHVEYKNIESDIRASGSVEVDERRLSYVQTRYAGWIKEVFASATYQLVNKGQPLFTIYSPELVASEQEYLLAKANLQRVSHSSLQSVSSGADTLLHSARERLSQWDLSDADISRLESSGKPVTEFTFASPVSGYVIERMALPNAYVQPDVRLYTIVDLTSVWVEAHIFQEDAGKLKPSDPAEVTVDAYPNRTFHARVEQVLPQMDPTTRTLRVRLTMPNPNLLLKPGMFVNVRLRAPLGRQLFVPASAVLQAGTRQVVFVSRGHGNFEPRDVLVGTHTDDGFVVLKGLQAGDVVATSANFLIDSESQLQAAAVAYAPPPAGAGNAMSMAQQVFAELTTDPSPPRKGKNNLQVKLTSDEKPLSGAKVTVRFHMPAMPGMGMAEMNSGAELNERESGTYGGQMELGSGGTWQVTVTAERGGKLVLTKLVNLTVTGGM
ncbi:MAG TPA: efflux RND transporter periplasmic adaptor subunit [Terriglobales bacterium]|jgi:Cu(I)/Ag(I) efflux system membrane fusion protein/cobalt-zinc-cadmium efflux system membrane fusion protein|nr:efflux RND transporter periplasmic adaptor subunit [Terriglobales bacterium]